MIDLRVRARVSACVCEGEDSDLLSHIRFHPCKHVARVCASVCYVAIWLYELPSVRCRQYPAVVPQNRSVLHVAADLISDSVFDRARENIVKLITICKN